MAFSRHITIDIILVFFFKHALNTSTLIRHLLELHPGANLERLERLRQTTTCESATTKRRPARGLASPSPRQCQENLIRRTSDSQELRREVVLMKWHDMVILSLFSPNHHKIWSDFG